MTNVEKARENGKVWAESLFKDMAKYAGPKFTWSGFPGMAKAIASSSCFLNFSKNTKHLPQLMQITGSVAYRRAKELVREVNL